MRIKKKFRTELSAALIFLLPNLAGFLLFIFIPILMSLLLSFFKCDMLQVKNIPEWNFIGIQNFIRLIGFHRENGILQANDPEFFRYLGNTLFLMMRIPITMCVSLFLAVLLNRQIKGRVFFRTIYFLPAICAGTALYILWRWILNADFGLLNLCMHKLSLGRINGLMWLSSTAWSKPGLILMNIWIEAGGVNMLIYLAALQGIPRDYYEACSLDGAGAWDRFRYITWPMLGPATFFILIMNLINGFQEGFQQAHIMTQGGPAGSTTMLSYYIYNQAYVWNHMGYAAAVSWVLFGIVISITAVSWKFGTRIVYYNR